MVGAVAGSCNRVKCEKNVSRKPLSTRQRKAIQSGEPYSSAKLGSHRQCALSVLCLMRSAEYTTGGVHKFIKQLAEHNSESIRSDKQPIHLHPKIQSARGGTSSFKVTQKDCLCSVFLEFCVHGSLRTLWNRTGICKEFAQTSVCSSAPQCALVQHQGRTHSLKEPLPGCKLQRILNT